MARYGLYGAMVRHSLVSSMGQKGEKSSHSKHENQDTRKAESEKRPRPAFDVIPESHEKHCVHNSFMRLVANRRREQSHVLV